MLEVHNISKKYTNHLALDHVSLNISRGSIYGLLGPNGAGKTTLIRIVNKIIMPDEGSVRFQGREMEQQDVFNIGYLPEERGLYKKMKVWEHALFLAQLKGLSKADATTRLIALFDKFQITNWKNKKIEELSKGMQQKVQFLTTIVHNPELLILDEPFSGFDPINTEILKNEVLDLKAKGKTIILSTHNMESVEELCDEISLVNTSKIVLQGNVFDIKNRFKDHTLILRINNSDFTFDTSFFSIISKDKQNGFLTIRLKKEKNVENSVILKMIADKYEIISFEEELPSMNDIFIKTVKPQ